MHTSAAERRESTETIQAHTRSVVAWWHAQRALLLSLCLRWTRGDPTEAEDLLSDACLRILEGGPSYSNVVSPIGFWATVINNLGRDRLRRRRRWNFDYRHGAADVLGVLPTGTINAEQQLFLRECVAATERKLAELNEKQRQAILLRSGGLDYGEIALALATSSTNARKLVETARKSLNIPNGLGVHFAGRRLTRVHAPRRRSHLVGS